MTSRLTPFTATAVALLAGCGIVVAASQAPTPAPRPPASSLASPDSPSKAPDADGFIRRWLVLEPIPVPPQLGEAAVQTLVKDARFAAQRTAMPSAGERAVIGDRQVAWHAVDTLGYNLN